MKELSSRIKDLNDMNNAINGAMASVLFFIDDGNGVISAEMYQSMAQLLSTLSSRCKALTDTLEGAASNLSATAKSLSGLLGTTGFHSSTISTTSATFSTITRVWDRTSLPRAKS